MALVNTQIYLNPSMAVIYYETTKYEGLLTILLDVLSWMLNLLGKEYRTWYYVYYRILKTPAKFIASVQSALNWWTSSNESDKLCHKAEGNGT